MTDLLSRFLKTLGDQPIEKHWDQFQRSLTDSTRMRLHEELFGVGPLKELIQRSDVSEIAVNARDSIFFQSHHRYFKHSDQFLLDWSYQHFIDRLLFIVGSNLSPEHPMNSFKWQQHRVQLTHPSITGHQTLINLRRLRTNATEFSKLALQPSKLNTLLQNGVHERKNILIIGPTGSGKTTLLESLLHSTTDRCAIVEDTQEVVLPNANSVRLLTRDHPRQITQSDLVRLALRLHPDRIILGEIRGGEAKDYLYALSSGHQGSLATLHASSPQQAVMRLELLIQSAAPGWSTSMIQKLLFLSLDWIVKLEINGGQRSIVAIHQTAALEKSGIVFDSL